MAGGAALFRQGFRPFFLGAGLWSFTALGLWLAALAGGLELRSAFDPVTWHAHEMLFGYAGAVIAGFLLTAIPNWTGRLPLSGAPLATLAAFWLAGRLAVATADLIGGAVAALLDLAFPAALLAVVLREILAGRNWRNLAMPVALGFLLVANALTHLDVLGLVTSGGFGLRLGLAVVILLICLIGGRIIPSFTRNWLVKQGASRLPATFGGFDRAALLLSAAALLTWLLHSHGLATAVLLLLAALVNFARLYRWRGLHTGSQSLVWSLHLGFLWVPVGLALLGLAALPTIDVAETAGLHALTAGAVGSMTLAVMTRASLGHSGRGLSADVPTTMIYLLVALAALTRTVAPLATGLFETLLWTSGIAWLAAYGLFTLHYGRILLAR